MAEPTENLIRDVALRLACGEAPAAVLEALRRVSPGSARLLLHAGTILNRSTPEDPMPPPPIRRGDTVVVTPDLWLTPIRVGRHWDVEHQVIGAVPRRFNGLLRRWLRHRERFASVATPEGRKFTSEKVCTVAIAAFVKQLGEKRGR